MRIKEPLILIGPQVHEGLVYLEFHVSDKKVFEFEEMIKSLRYHDKEEVHRQVLVAPGHVEYIYTLLLCGRTFIDDGFEIITSLENMFGDQPELLSTIKSEFIYVSSYMIEDIILGHI